jgi:hypothetical protein
MSPSANAIARQRSSCFRRAAMGYVRRRRSLRMAHGCLRVLALLLALSVLSEARADTYSLIIAANASPRVQFGAEMLLKALTNSGSEAVIAQDSTVSGRRILIGYLDGLKSESFSLESLENGDVRISGGDDSGELYGCLELAQRIRAAGKLSFTGRFQDGPQFKLRGTCIGMQKTFILPGRHVYEYPYTPELFPWFYDKELWREYLDFLAANRMNTLYLWSGHPFASLVRVKEYPYAVEVPDDIFAKNQEMYRWLAQECDKRGIWLVQMFYNILVSKPFAETNGISTQLSAPTPLTADYTRKSIAEFVRQYPNVGLMVCLGEALQGTSNQLQWATQVILPGVHDGMAAAGLKGEPPVIIRTHAMDADAIMPACFQVYSNIYTESKYNGESLTTWEPRGKDQAIQLHMAQLGPHLVNIHILSNLEPFRYGDQDFIKKCMQAARDRLGATGLHLYPLSYWNWPYSPDIADPPLKQWDRDWIWYEAWARYAWNPDVPDAEDHAYWVSRLADFYGNTNASEDILSAYNAAGEIAPRLIRRFGITEGNRQTLSLGMTLDQLVNPMKYGAIEDLWLSQAPQGERLDEYVKKEWKHEAHVGETPVSILHETDAGARLATDSIEFAVSLVTKNRNEALRLQNDVLCISLMNKFYTAKVNAAADVLRYGYSHDLQDMKAAETNLAESLDWYRQLSQAATPAYHFANGMQTSQRKIPVSGGSKNAGGNFLWSQLLPVYEKELRDFQARVATMEQGTNAVVTDDSLVAPLPKAAFKLISTNAEIYTVKPGARVFSDEPYKIVQVAAELKGLKGIRFSHEKAKAGQYDPIEIEAAEPVQVLVGYFKDTNIAWLQVPKLEFAAQADERGGVDAMIENAAAIENCPALDIHAFRYEAGRQKLEFIGKGSFVILGIVPQSAEIKKRDARCGVSK